MKKAVLFLLPLVASFTWAQQALTPEPSPDGTVATTLNFPVERVQTPGPADFYCAGFISKPVPKDKFILAGLDSPSTTRFANRDAIYLNGKGYELGQQYSIVRELTDPNRYELFKGQWAALKAAGQPYAELGRVRIIDTRGKTTIAKVEFSCDGVVPGDLVVPFVEKQMTSVHPPLRFDRFAPSNGQVSGRILLAKDFDSELGTTGKVYINIGANQGLKVGDFLRVERAANALLEDPVESASVKAPAYEPTQTRPAVVDPDFLTRSKGPVIHTNDMPRRGVGELVIVGTTPTTATGMIVFSLEPVHVGDTVQLDPQ